LKNWNLVSSINCPILLIWGKYSTFLTYDKIEKFYELRSDLLSLVKVLDSGHAPLLNNENIIKTINSWIISNNLYNMKEVLSGEIFS